VRSDVFRDWLDFELNRIIFVLIILENEDLLLSGVGIIFVDFLIWEHHLALVHLVAHRKLGLIDQAFSGELNWLFNAVLDETERKNFVLRVNKFIDIEDALLGRGTHFPIPITLNLDLLRFYRESSVSLVSADKLIELQIQCDFLIKLFGISDRELDLLHCDLVISIFAMEKVDSQLLLRQQSLAPINTFDRSINAYFVSRLILG
jgi:hypothetical protein